MYNNQQAMRTESDLVGIQDVNDPRYGKSDDSSLFTFWLVIRVLRKWWWLIGLITLASVALTVLSLSRVTPMYAAQATLEVKQQERNIVGIANVEDINANKEFLVTQIELLQSETLAEDVIESLNLTADPDFFDAEAEGASSLTRVQKMRNVVLTFKQRLRVTSIGNSRLIKLQFEHSNPNKSALIANTITDSFINDSLKRKYNATAYAREFLQNRLATVKASLEEAERNLVRYASDNGILLLDNDDSSSSSGSLDKTALVKLDNQLTQASTDRMKAEQAYNDVDAESFSLEILQNASLNELKRQRRVLNSEYIEKLAVYKPRFPEMVELKSRIELFDEAIEAETSEIVTANRKLLETRYNFAKAQEADLERRVSALKDEVVGLRERSIEYTILKREVDTERTQYEALLQRLKEVSVAQDVGANLVEVVDKAKPARSPFKPKKARTLLIALLLSSSLSFALAYAIEFIDDRIKQPEDIKVKLGQTIMGVIPRVQSPTELMDLLTDSQTSISEAYASLRANLQFSGIDGGPRIIQLTSTQPGEGKSVSSLGLALRYVGLGKKTLLIDADMRRPTFNVEGNEPKGLSYLLTSRDDISSHIMHAKHEGLDVLTSGQAVPNPSEALSSERFNEVLESARERYSYIIVDSPPVIGLADAPILGAKVDATLVIVEYNRLRTSNIKAAIERLTLSGTRIIGVVLTKHKANALGYGYGYGYGYYNNSYVKNADTPRGRPKKSSKSQSKQTFTLG